MIITGERGSGKTRKLIEVSSETGQTIVVSHDYLVGRTLGLAKELGLKIPPPITIVDAINQREISDYLIDDVECVLSYLLNGKIHAMTTSEVIA